MTDGRADDSTMTDGRAETPRGRARVAVEMAVLFLGSVLVFGSVVALLAGAENFVPGAGAGAVVGYILVRLRRELYGQTGR